MKKYQIFLLHFCYWCLYVFCILTLLIFIKVSYNPKLISENDQKQAIRQFVIILFYPALVGYMSYYFILFPKFLKKKKIVLMFLLGIIFALLGGLIGLGFISLMENKGNTKQDLILVFILASFISLLNGSMGLIIKGFVSWFSEVKEKDDLKQKNHQMELALVKSQLDPHFLFNTLNNIDVLILKDAEKASLFLNKLSDIMRFMLFETKDEKIELAKEITYIEKYIELQKIRTSNPNYVTVSIDIEDDTVLISPMLFIPFIENAFKYAEPFKSENAIEIRIKATHNKLDFECDNKCSNHSNSISNNGLGNELIQKRLALLYPEQHHLEITELNGVFKVKLSIDL